MCLALCPASYDPVTNGHINIIRRCANLFDKTIVVVMENADRKAFFSPKERVWMLEQSVRELSNVKVEYFDGLVTEYARKIGADVLVKGLRANTDFEDEFQMALTNRRLNSDMDTVFMATDTEYRFLSPGTVSEVAKHMGKLREFVPEIVEEFVMRRLGGPQ